MEDVFNLEVEYKGTLHTFEAQLQLLGYIHRFVVTLPDGDVWFERDEEGAYRAIIPPEEIPKKQNIDVDLLQCIAQKIEAVLA